MPTLLSTEIHEDYHYYSYDEFKQHYNEMLDKGFLPYSNNSKPDYYSNLEMECYYAHYYKRIVNYENYAKNGGNKDA